MVDRANGYDTVAEEFARRRSASIGVAQVRDWATSLPPGAEVLDVGCGTGVPITAALLDAGCRVHAIDASPRLLARFATQFPVVPASCESVESMTHFGRRFDGVLAWGLIFLLPADLQVAAVARLARAVGDNGELLFTAPAQVIAWNDSLTGRGSYGLGAPAYRQAITGASLTLVGEFDDEGGNHYYRAQRRTV